MIQLLNCQLVSQSVSQIENQCHIRKPKIIVISLIRPSMKKKIYLTNSKSCFLVKYKIVILIDSQLHSMSVFQLVYIAVKFE